VDQRIDVDRLDRQAGPDRHRAIDPQQFGRGGEQQRTDPLAAADRGIAHSLDQARAGITRDRQQRVEAGVDLVLDALQRGLEHGPLPPALG
jgi:hypothetical protein